jgi:hypothetical protein
MPWNDSLSAVHNDDMKVVASKKQPIPHGVNERNIPFGGHESTALNAVNYVEVDWAAVEQRNTGYIQQNIANRRAHEKAT